MQINLHSLWQDISQAYVTVFGYCPMNLAVTNLPGNCGEEAVSPNLFSEESASLWGIPRTGGGYWLLASPEMIGGISDVRVDLDSTQTGPRPACSDVRDSTHAAIDNDRANARTRTHRTANNIRGKF
ncbi:hypothetical protein J6590_068139 [Homalodisca vitripennis]|nr:hypothetical protein J6590_068139 [Homalodisca vitripennis]